MIRTSPNLSTSEVAELLGVTKQTVLRLVASRDIPAFRVGTSKNAPIRIPRDELDRYVERNKVCAES